MEMFKRNNERSVNISINIVSLWWEIKFSVIIQFFFLMALDFFSFFFSFFSPLHVVDEGFGTGFVYYNFFPSLCFCVTVFSPISLL